MFRSSGTLEPDATLPRPLQGPERPPQGSPPARAGALDPAGPPAALPPTLPPGSPLAAIDRARVGVVTVDVFDTLLLRRPVSERRRLRRIAELASCRLRGTACAGVEPDRVSRARGAAQRMAFRAMEAFRPAGEVRLDDVLARQVEILRWPPEAVAVLRAAELDVEARCVAANRTLWRDLAAIQAAGLRVVAVSDTTWTAAMTRALLRRAGERAGGGALAVPLDAVHTSADHGATKREGTLFARVAEAEGFAPARAHHLGDDAHADVAMARRAGLAATHLPRSRAHVLLRRADGARTEAAGALSRRRRAPGPKAVARPAVAPRPKAVARPGADAARNAAAQEALGRDVFGPVLADVLLQLWLYLRSAERDGAPVALFCARGGLSLRAAFERFLARTALPLDVPRRDFMVSRLVAARGAVLGSGDGVLEELAREFAGASTGDVLRALAGPGEGGGEGERDGEGQGGALPRGAWAAPFDAARLRALLREPEARAVRERIARQHALFERHVRDACGGRDRAILVDTGLYGSTLRLLREAMGAPHWEAAMIARCNYKGFDAPHFDAATGLVVERDGYSPLHAPSAVLRYWQLVEDLLEPDLASVTRFAGGDGGGQGHGGRVVSNLEAEGWRERIAARPMLRGAMSHLDALEPADARDVPHRADAAWRALRRLIAFPSAPEARLLGVCGRSRDFGRTESVAVAARATGDVTALATLRTSLWKEGTIALMWPRARLPLQGAVELAHLVRDVRRRVRPRPRPAAVGAAEAAETVGAAKAVDTAETAEAAARTGPAAT